MKGTDTMCRPEDEAGAVTEAEEPPQKRANFQELCSVMEKSSRPSSLAEKDPGAWKPPSIPHTPGSVGAYSSPAASVHITEHGVVSTQHIGADLDSMLLSLTACRCPPKIHGAFSK